MGIPEQFELISPNRAVVTARSSPVPGSVGRAGAVQVCAPREAACEFLRLSSSQPAWDEPTGLVGSSRAADRVVNVAFFMLRSRRSRSHVRTYVSVDASCAACHMHHSLHARTFCARSTRTRAARAHARTHARTHLHTHTCTHTHTHTHTPHGSSHRLCISLY